jgi:hypothetical protein
MTITDLVDELHDQLRPRELEWAALLGLVYSQMCRLRAADELLQDIAPSLSSAGAHGDQVGVRLVRPLSISRCLARCLHMSHSEAIAHVDRALLSLDQPSGAAGTHWQAWCVVATTARHAQQVSELLPDYTLLAIPEVERDRAQLPRPVVDVVIAHGSDEGLPTIWNPPLGIPPPSLRFPLA